MYYYLLKGVIEDLEMNEKPNPTVCLFSSVPSVFFNPFLKRIYNITFKLNENSKLMPLCAPTSTSPRCPYAGNASAATQPPQSL